MAVLFLDEVELLDAAVGVGSDVVPRVGGVPLFCVGIRVRSFAGRG